MAVISNQSAYSVGIGGAYAKAFNALVNLTDMTVPAWSGRTFQVYENMTDMTIPTWSGRTFQTYSNMVDTTYPLYTKLISTFDGISYISGWSDRSFQTITDIADTTYPIWNKILLTFDGTVAEPDYNIHNFNPLAVSMVDTTYIGYPKIMPGNISTYTYPQPTYSRAFINNPLTTLVPYIRSTGILWPKGHK